MCTVVYLVMANAYLFLDTRRALADGSYKVRLRISNERKSKYFSIPYSFKSDKDFNTALKKDTSINKNLDRANKIIAELEPFSFDAFEKRYNSKGDRTDIISMLNEVADSKRSEGKISSANLYQQAANLFLKYATEKKKEKYLKVESLTVKELKDFEAWAVENGYSLTTIGMYLIRTKAVFNSLIRTGEVKKAKYPFGLKKDGLYPIPKANNAKRPLSVAEIMLLFNFEAETDLQSFSRDIFIFSYLANGMNFYDIFKLRWSDIDKDQFTFVRTKTAHKKDDKIVVRLNEDLNAIIERHGKRQIGNDYIFSVLKSKMTKEAEHKAVRCKVTSINQCLKIIARKVGIPETISGYFARHSFANNLMNSEAPLAFISKKLGHSDIKTTMQYTSSFTVEKDDQYTSNLLQKTS